MINTNSTPPPGAPLSINNKHPVSLGFPAQVPVAFSFLHIASQLRQHCMHRYIYLFVRAARLASFGHGQSLPFHFGRDGEAFLYILLLIMI